MARNTLVAGNWKLHGAVAKVEEFCAEISRGIASEGDQLASLLVCPPFIYVAQMAGLFKGSGVSVGSQNVCEQVGPGAFTGEVSAAMLADVGCSHVIVGHSERRHIYGEDDEMVAAKFAAAQAAGVTPILCVGETLEQREAGDTQEVLRRQLGAVLAHCGVKSFAEAVIAYEPVWAIGTGKTASPEQAQEAHAFLRSLVNDEDATIAGEIGILYGGSVKPDNAAQLFACEDVDGGLIGGAALEAESLLAIARA